MQYGDDEHYYPEDPPRRPPTEREIALGLTFSLRYGGVDPEDAEPETNDGEIEYLDALADGSYMGWNENLIAPKMPPTYDERILALMGLPWHSKERMDAYASLMAEMPAGPQRSVVKGAMFHEIYSGGPNPLVDRTWADAITEEWLRQNPGMARWQAPPDLLEIQMADDEGRPWADDAGATDSDGCVIEEDS
jgi:hypothetical protein